jgi:hypothetical protein
MIYYNLMKPFLKDPNGGGVKKDIREIFTSINNKSLYWKFGLVFLVIVFPLLLLVAQYLVLRTIPPQFTISYLVLNFSQPTVSGMFFSNYIHTVFTINHVLDNFNGYLLVISLLVLVYFFIIPLLKKRHVLLLNYPDIAFFATSAVFFLLFPFAGSGMSILFGRMLGQTGTWGFSGIVWAFLAYFYFLFLMLISDMMISHFNQGSDDTSEEILESVTTGTQTKRSEKPTYTTLAGSLIFLTALFIILPMYTIFLDIGNKKINVFGHFSGFVLGFLISALVVLICERKDKRGKIVLVGLLGFIIGIPAVIWMAM